MLSLSRARLFVCSRSSTNESDRFLGRMKLFLLMLLSLLLLLLLLLFWLLLLLLLLVLILTTVLTVIRRKLKKEETEKQLEPNILGRKDVMIAIDLIFTSLF